MVSSAFAVDFKERTYHIRPGHAEYNSKGIHDRDDIGHFDDMAIIIITKLHGKI